MILKADKSQATSLAKYYRRSDNVAGFTLIEVLLAAGIVVLGMTGILTMQVVGIRITEDSYHRTKAVTLAYQMTDAIRASCAEDGYDTAYNGFTACRSGNRHAEDDQICTIDALGEIEDDGTSIVDDVLQAWWNNLDQANLPHWFAEIQGATDGVVRVAVQWDKERVNEHSPDAASQQDDTSPAPRKSCLDNGLRALPVGVEEVCLSTKPACS